MSEDNIEMDEASKEEARLMASLAGAKKKAHQNALGPGLGAAVKKTTSSGNLSQYPTSSGYQPRTSTGTSGTNQPGTSAGTYLPRTSTGPITPVTGTTYQPRVSNGPTPSAPYQPRVSTGPTQPTTTYQPRVSTGPTQPATTYQPRVSTGPIPAWKVQQLEKEKREQEKIAEEERKRKEKMQMSGGVVEESVVTLGGPPQYQNFGPGVDENFNPGNPGVCGPGNPGNRGGGEIDSSSVAKEVDFDTLLKLEEERLMKKTINTAPVGGTKELKRGDSQVGIGKKVKVSWIDRNTNRPIMSHEWYCSQDRLPLKAIMHEWKIKNLVWADLEQSIQLQPDGFSDLTFSGIPYINVYADPI